MKKTRLISLLLTAALTASCLPMAVAAADDENLLDGATYTGVQVKTDEVDKDGNPIFGGTTVAKASFKNSDQTPVVKGNRFVTIAKRAYNYGQGFTINYRLTEDEIKADVGSAENPLFFKWDMRQSVPSNTDEQYGAIGSNGIWAPFHSSGRYSIDGASGIGIFDSSIHSGNWRSTGEIKFTVNSAKALHTIGFKKSGNATSVQDIDIDNVQVYYKDADKKPVYIVNITDDFLAPEIETGEVGKDGNPVKAKVFAPVYKVATLPSAIVFEDVEEDYYIADSDSDNNTEVLVELDTPILPGTYILTGEFRLGEFTADGFDYEFTAGINDADIIIAAGDSASEAVNVNTVWTYCEFPFVVTEETDALTILVDGKDDTVDDPQKINFRNLNLVQETSFSRKISAGEENLLNGTVVTYNGTYDVDGGYLSIPARTSDMAYEFIDFIIPTKPVAGAEYFLAFDVCSRDHGTYQFLINGGFTTEDASAHQYDTISPYPTYESGAEGMALWSLEYSGDKYQVKYDPAEGVWQHVETSFIPLENTTNRMKFSVHGKNADSLGAIDFDNIELWYFNDAKEKVVLYSNEFNSAADLDTKSGTVSSQFPALGHGVIPAAYTVTPVDAGVTACYDVAKAANKDSTYTFSANVASVADGEIYLSVVYADGSTEKTAPVAVTADGAELTFTADRAIKSIKIITNIGDAVTIVDETLTCAEPEIAVSMGDANGDNRINPLDVVCFRRYLAGWTDYADLNPDVLDLNGLDGVTVNDAIALARHIAKWKGYETIDGIYGMKYDN